jgi:hypothetical protein
MHSSISLILSADNRTTIDTYLRSECNKRNHTFSDSATYIDEFHRFAKIAIDPNVKYKNVSTTASELSLLFAIAHCQLAAIHNYYVSEQSNLLINQTIDAITEKFGINYYSKNPHVFTAVLNTFRSVFIANQEKR